MGSFVSVGTAALSASNQYIEGAKEEAAVEYNARLDEQQAEIEVEKNKLEEYRRRKYLDAFVGQQTASYAKSGVEFTGSPLDVEQDTIANAELEMSINKFNSDMEARRLRDQARLSRKYGKSVRIAKQTEKNLTVLSNVGNAASSFYSFRSSSGGSAATKTKIGE